MERADLLANKYAEGFFSAAQKANKIEEAFSEVGLFSTLLTSFEKIPRWLDSPVLRLEEKIEFLEGICDGFGFNDITRTFLKLLTRNKRMGLFHLIYRAVNARYNTHRGFVDVEITTARPLKEEEKKLFLHIWGTFVGSYLEVKQRVDPSIIAGMVVKFRGKKYDASMMRTLAQLKEAMLQ